MEELPPGEDFQLRGPLELIHLQERRARNYVQRQALLRIRREMEYERAKRRRADIISGLSILGILILLSVFLYVLHFLF